MKITDYKYDKKAKQWHLIDAQDQILGRLATKVARLLMGKNKPQYTPLFDSGDYVVIVNAKQIKLSGFKAEQKKYHRHTGYLGGLKTTTFKEMKIKKPAWIIYNAVRKMLPKNLMGDKMLKKLRVYPEAEHPHQGAKFINQ
ncbi:MAG: 50S ribosomal protein L13 [Patescibacteria group bacterium]